MNYRIIKTILRKELLETLRDKRTLFAMVGLPIILYPLVFLIMTQVTIIQQSKLDAQKSRVVVLGTASEEFGNWLTNAATEEKNFADPNRACQLLDNISITKLQADMAEKILAQLKPQSENASTKGLILSDYQLDAVIVAQFDTNMDGPPQSQHNISLSIHYDNTAPTSQQARGRIAELLSMYREIQMNRRLVDLGITPQQVEPVTIRSVDIAPLEKTMGSILGRILPMLIIISLAIAAFYPALDLTAGEKERGTFETLLSTPTRKTEIVTGKFLAIFTLAMITASLSLGSMALTLFGQMSQFANAAGTGISPIASLKISPQTILIMLLVLIPLAFFICSAMMSIALFARNIQEAQHYVTPFYLCIVLPAVIAAIPTIEITTFTMLMPIINVALLFKELLIGNFDLNIIAGVFISISCWALLALTVSVRLFQSEQLILSQEKGLPITIKRSLLMPAKHPSMTMSLGLFAFCLLGLFYIGAYFQSLEMISGLIITEWLVVLTPVLVILWFFKIDIKNTLSLKLPRWYEPILSIVMIMAANIIIMRLGIEQAKHLPVPDVLKKLAETMIVSNPTWGQTLTMLFTMAVSAAVCEEVLFRGAVLSGLQQPGKNPMPAILITASLFAIMHLSVYRLMPTFLLGLVLTYLTWSSGSILNSMLAHCFNNALPVLLMHNRLPDLADWLGKYEGDDPRLIEPMPIGLILAAIAAIVFVIYIMETTRKSENYGRRLM